MVCPNFAIRAQCQVWFGQFLDGLPNSSGYVGQNLLFNGAPSAIGLFDAPFDAYKSAPINKADGNVHLRDTCRLGNDANSSVVDRYNRSHDVPNLFMVDGSSLVTGDRGQPTMRSWCWHSGLPLT